MEYSRQQKGRLRFGIVAVLSLFLFYTFSPLLTRTAMADTPTYAAMNPQDQAKSYALYYAMLQCFDGIGEISNDDVIAGTVSGPFGKNSVAGWYLDKTIGDGGDGKIECGTAEKAAQSLWGYPSFDDMLVDFGYINPGNGKDWKNSDPTGKIANSLKNRVFGGSTPVLGGAEKYLYFRGTLEAACEISNPIDFATAPSSMQSAAESGTEYIKLTEPTDDYKGTVEKIYTVGSWKTIAYSFFPSGTPSPPNMAVATCREVAKIASAEAGSYASWAVVNVAQAQAIDGTNGDGTEATSTCGVANIGWIICPVMTFLSGIMDDIFTFLSQHFLSTNPSLVKADPANGTFVAWGVFRSFANIAFIFAFLTIIYSQITGAGISNYGLKRMLPRLIVAALMVNLSLYICQAAIDLSNLLGYGASSIFDGVAQSATTAGSPAPSWTIYAAKALAVGAAAIGLALLASIIVPALLAALMIVLILTAREALIVLLVVVSPLAFVAYLLPNTEKFFKQWMGMFWKLLLVFPIIAMVFGVSKLTSSILYGIGIKSGDQGLMVTALGVTVIPFFVVPGLLKGAVAATGALGAKLQGMGNSATGRLHKDATGKVKEKYNNSAFARGRELRRQNKDAYKTKKFAEAVSGTGANPTSWRNRARARAARGVIGHTWTDAGDDAQQKMESKALATVTAAENRDDAEGIEVARQAQQSMTTKQLVADVINNPSASKHAKSAAIDRIMTTGSGDERREVIESIIVDRAATAADPSRKSEFNASQVSSAIQGAYKKGDGETWGKGFGNAILDGSITDAAGLSAAAVQNAAEGNVTAEHWANDPKGMLWLAEQVKAHTAATGDTTARDKLKLVATAAQTAASTAAKLNDVHSKAELLL